MNEDILEETTTSVPTKRGLTTHLIAFLVFAWLLSARSLLLDLSRIDTSILSSVEKFDVDSTNILFVKTVKTGSTTTAGIVRRIAYYHGLHGAKVGYTNFPLPLDTAKITAEPGIFCDHREWYQSEPMLQDLRRPTFVFTIVRDPVLRSISNFQYAIHKNGHNAMYEPPEYLKPYPRSHSEWEQRFLEFVKRQSKHCQYHYIKNNRAKEELGWSGAQVAEIYDLVMVLERYNESVVVLKNMLNGVSFGDVLYALNSKYFGYEWGGDPLSQEAIDNVKAHFSDSKDYEVIARANELLDEKISRIPNFKSQLFTYTSLLKSAEKICTEKSPRSDCLYEDQSCGNQCLTCFFNAYTSSMSSS